MQKVYISFSCNSYSFSSAHVSCCVVEKCPVSGVKAKDAIYAKSNDAPPSTCPFAEKVKQRRGMQSALCTLCHTLADDHWVTIYCFISTLLFLPLNAFQLRNPHAPNRHRLNASVLTIAAGVA